MYQLYSNQRGATLFIALVFLIIITLISITAMRTSTLELLMATNEQERRIAVDATESATDAVANSNRIKIGADGDVTCFGFGSLPTGDLEGNACTDYENMATGAGYGADSFVQVTMNGTGTCPPSIASSARGSTSLRTSGNSSIGGCAYFTIESEYDAVAKRGGYSLTQEGFIRLAF